MIAYPITLTPDDNGTLLITSPDFPELASFGDTVEDALFRAQGALLEAIEARIHDREPAVKVLLYQAMRADGVRKSELARRMRIPRQEVDRILDLNHGTALPKMELAFAVLGKQLSVAVGARAKRPNQVSRG